MVESIVKPCKKTLFHATVGNHHVYACTYTKKNEKQADDPDLFLEESTEEFITRASGEIIATLTIGQRFYPSDVRSIVSRHPRNVNAWGNMFARMRAQGRIRKTGTWQGSPEKSCHNRIEWQYEVL